jgi:hypothetical protein
VIPGQGKTSYNQLTIYTNGVDNNAPVHSSDNNIKIARLTIKMEDLPYGNTKVLGGHSYYTADGFVEARYGSVMVTYVLMLEGKSQPGIASLNWI